MKNIKAREHGRQHLVEALVCNEKIINVVRRGLQLSTSQLNKETIIPGLNSRMRVKHVGQGSKRFKTKAQIKELLHALDEVEEEHKQMHRQKNKERKNGRGKKKDDDDPNPNGRKCDSIMQISRAQS